MITETTNEEEDVNVSIGPTLGAVLYCDGSSKPNPGKIGWGVHGYLYEQKEIKAPVFVSGYKLTNKGYFRVEKPKHTEQELAAISLELGISVDEARQMAENDSAAITNPSEIEPLKYVDFFGSSAETGTNNRAEVYAIINGVKKVIELGVRSIFVLTDSEYAKRGIKEWLKRWYIANWKKHDGSPLPNADLWQELHTLIENLRRSQIHFDVDWVRGHNDNLGNVQADILACIGTNHSQDNSIRHEYTISDDAKNYWKSERETHPFINFKRVYFNSVQHYNTPGHYYQADPGAGDFMIGKKTPETGYSVLRLGEYDEVIESIKEKQCKVANGDNAIFMIKLDKAYERQVYPYIANYGGYSLVKEKNNLNLNFISGRPIIGITTEINPSGLSLRAIESFNFLEELLDKFIHYKENGYDSRCNVFNLQAHDITDTFYHQNERVIKGESKIIHNLKSEYGVGCRHLKVSIVRNDISAEVPMILGLDILPRNNLKKLESLSPKIYLLTWSESPKSFRYATVIQCESGIGIWSNFFSDRIFI